MKPNHGLGVLLGVVAGWLSIVVVALAGGRLARARVVSLDSSLGKTLPWLLLLLVVAAAFAALLAVRWLSAGALVGAGGLMTIVGLALLLLPIRTAIDLSKAFQVPGSTTSGYVHWDGSLPFLGVILLVLGIRRWQSDIARLQQLVPPVRVSNPQPPSRLPYAGQQGYPAAPADPPGSQPGRHRGEPPEQRG